MWWSGLPGIDAPEIADGKTDRVIALACALRFRAADPNDDGSGYGVSDIADDFLDWLADGGAPNAGNRRARRLALCLACERIPASARRADIEGVAKWMYRWLIKTT
jgi:hypothetical protein